MQCVSFYHVNSFNFSLNKYSLKGGLIFNEK